MTAQAGTFAGWSPHDNYVQAGMRDGLYASGAFTMLAAGPPRISGIGASVVNAGNLLGGDLDRQSNQIVYPMGITQSFSLQQNTQVNRLFELGSNRSYHISGRSVGQISLGRVFYHASSLLRLLYAYYQDVQGATIVQPMFNNVGAASAINPHDVIVPPGYDNIFLNLASDLFSQPVGMLLYMKDTNLQVLGASYFEHVLAPTHSLSMDAGNVVIQEQVQLQYERMVPVRVTGLTLITGAPAQTY